MDPLVSKPSFQPQMIFVSLVKEPHHISLSDLNTSVSMGYKYPKNCDPLCMSHLLKIAAKKQKKFARFYFLYFSHCVHTAYLSIQIPLSRPVYETSPGFDSFPSSFIPKAPASISFSFTANVCLRIEKARHINMDDLLWLLAHCKSEAFCTFTMLQRPELTTSFHSQHDYYLDVTSDCLCRIVCTRHMTNKVNQSYF